VSHNSKAIEPVGHYPALIPREVLFGNPVKASPKISPDGRKLAYLAPDNGVMNVWVRPFGLPATIADQDRFGGSDDRVVTASAKRPITQYFWQGDSQHLLFIQDMDGDENYHVYQVDIATAVVRDLTAFENVHAMPIAIDPLCPDQILVGVNARDPRLHDVYRIDLKTGESTLDTENPGDVQGWTADHQLNVRVAQVTRKDGSTEIRVRKDGHSPWRVAMAWGVEESFGGVVGFTDDNGSIRVLSSVDANAARLIELEQETGRVDVISEDPRYDVSSVLVHPRTHQLQAVQYSRERKEWSVLDPALQLDFSVIAGNRDGDFDILSRDLDDATWIIGYVVDDGPTYFDAYDRASGELTPLFSNRPALTEYVLAKTMPIAFTARDGMSIHGYLTLPVGLAPHNLPMILLVLGGPWARDSWGFSPHVQWLANRCYAVLQINFRGSTGYGKAYLNAGNREWAGKMHTDLLDGKRWAIREGYADPERVGIMGGSYGGYAALVGVAHTPDEFVCGVDLFGPSDISTLFSSIPPYWEPIKGMFLKRVGDPTTEEAFVRSCSPLYLADQIKVPLLIAQGANDARVKQAESDQIVAAVRGNNHSVDYIVFPDEGHGFARPENSLKFTAAAEGFLARHLGGQAEPAGIHESVEGLEQ